MGGAKNILPRVGTGHKRLHEYRGEMLTIGQLAALSDGIQPRTLANRLNKGWPIEKALRTPVDPMHKPPTKNLVSGAPDDRMFDAALAICKHIMGDPKASGLRCIRPDAEYAFDGDYLCWRIYFDTDGLARLAAYYRASGMRSDFNRTFRVIGKTVTEVKE